MWLATIAVTTFHIMLSSAMGLKAFGISYLGLPSFLRTTVTNSFQCLYVSLFSSKALYMCLSLSAISSAHFVSTILGIPSGPGALNGFSFLSCALICSAVMVPALSHSEGYMAPASMSSEGGLSGKKPFASMCPFSAFMLAVVSSPSMMYFNAGILVFPPSPQDLEVSWCAAHMSGSSAFSNHSLQCCVLVCSRVLW